MAGEWDVVSHVPMTADPWAVVSHEALAPPKEGDPVPAGGAPKGFYAVTEDDGKQTLRHEAGLEDIARALSDLPGVGMAERTVQGGARLAGKAASGIAGIFGADPAELQGVVNRATELPESRDPLVQATNLAQRGAQAVAAPVDRAVGNLSAGPRTAIDAGEEAVPDIATVLGIPGVPRLGIPSALRTVQRALTPEQVTAQEIARSAPEVGKAVGYTGLKTRADMLAPGNQAITDALISKDAGIIPGQRPSVAALENARRVG